MQLTLDQLTKSLLALAITTTVIGCSSTLPTQVDVDRKQNLALPQVISDAVSLGYNAFDREKYAVQGLLNNHAVKSQTQKAREVFYRLVHHVAAIQPEAGGWSWEIHVIDRGVVNAYAVGAGKVMVYRGLIEQLALSEDELAFVVAHEMAHNLRLHMRENLSNLVPFELAATGLSQTISPWGSAMVMDYGVMKTLSRAQETEADRLGLELMARAGFDPDAAQRVFQKFYAHELMQREAMAFEQLIPRSDYLRTHPLSEARQADVQQQSNHVTDLYALSDKFTPSEQPLSSQTQVNIHYIDGYEKLYLVGRIAPQTVFTRLLHAEKDISYGADLGYGWLFQRTPQGGLSLHTGLSFFHGDPQIKGNFGGWFTEVGWVFGHHWQTYGRWVSASELDTTGLQKQKLSAGLRWGDYNNGHLYLEAGPARAKPGASAAWQNTYQAEFGYAFNVGLF